MTTMQLKGIDYVLYLKSPCGENQAILRHEEFFFFKKKRLNMSFW